MSKIEFGKQLLKLITNYTKATGKAPQGLDLLKLRMKAAEIIRDAQKLIKVDFSKNNPQDWTGLPKVLKNVKNPNQVRKLLESGDIKIGQVSKTRPKDPSKLLEALKLSNKQNAYKSALRQAKEIDKKKLTIKEVETRYKNLAKYPEGRVYLNDEIYDIERGWTLNNLGNRSKEELIKKMRGYINKKGSSQADPFKKPVKEEVKGQIEMDFTDWDPKGMKGGGVAHMLGEEPRVGMMYGGDPGFAFEYGGSWADWRDNHMHMMPLTEYISTKLPKDRIPFRTNFKDGLEVLPEIQFSKITSSPTKEIDIDETDRTYGIKGSYQAPSWYTGGSLLKGKVKIDVTHDGNTIFKDTISKEDAKDLYFGLGKKYGDKVELGTDTKGNWRINIKKSFKDGGVANMLGE
jgi:hypothetical protein